MAEHYVGITFLGEYILKDGKQLSQPNAILYFVIMIEINRNQFFNSSSLCGLQKDPTKRYFRQLHIYDPFGIWLKVCCSWLRVKLPSFVNSQMLIRERRFD
jgi:hypothetical protein